MITNSQFAWRCPVLVTGVIRILTTEVAERGAPGVDSTVSSSYALYVNTPLPRRQRVTIHELSVGFR